MMRVEEYRHFYNRYFREFNRLAVGEFAECSYGKDEPNDTASSLESCVAYLNFINYGGSLLNAGAGASSWVFRKLHPFPSRVTCADPHPQFLKLVQKVCRENDLPDTQFYSNLKFKADSFDHVYFDYGNIERLPYLGAAIDIARCSVYVDDVDTRQCCYDYRDITIKLCEAMGLKWFDCNEALDSYGRSGIIIVKQ